MKKFIQLTAGFSMFIAVILSTAQVNVFAQSSALRINPRTDATVRAGETQSGSLLISNLNREIGITVDLQIVDFKSADETGSPSPILEEGVDPTPWSLEPFITFPNTLELKAGETKYVPYSIRIPEGQGAGSYYSAIKYNPRPAEGEENVVISGAPMQLFFITVPGRATEIMNLKRFGAYNIEKGETIGDYSSVFVGRQPAQLAYLLQNVGNVAESPIGTIVIKNMLGKEVAKIENANPKKSLALIDQTRRFDVCIDSVKEEIEQDGRKTEVETCKSPGFLPGMYTAEMNLFYGINGSSTQEINAKTSFWYLPFWFLGVVLAVLAVIAYVILKVRNALIGSKRHNRRR